jgi:hypothetical protein
LEVSAIGLGCMTMTGGYNLGCSIGCSAVSRMLFRLGRDPYAVVPSGASAAVTISFVKMSGCETMEAREARTSSIVDVAAGGHNCRVAGVEVLDRV